MRLYLILRHHYLIFWGTPRVLPYKGGERSLRPIHFAADCLKSLDVTMM